jgi:Methyltransferase domain
MTAADPFNGDYLALLERIHDYLLPRTYVEIGVFQGKSLSLTLPGTLGIGIDPAPSIRHPIDRSAKLFKLTSDDFFTRYDLGSVLEGQAVDLAFIDGMHLFEFTLRDFLHLERYCTEESTILVHDVNPLSEQMAARVRTSGLWSGDVWKLVPCLKEYRPDLRVATVDVPPAGLGIISGLDRNSTTLAECFEEICARSRKLDYAAIREDREAILNRVASDWSVVRTRLPSRPFRSGDTAQLRHQARLRRRTPAAALRRARGIVGESRFGPPLRALIRPRWPTNQGR